MRKRSVTLNGHRTSIALEEAFWVRLERFAQEDRKTLAALIAKIDRERLRNTPPPGLASAIRAFVVSRLDPDGR